MKSPQAYLLVPFFLLLILPSLAFAATTADLTVGGSAGPINATTGIAVVFDLNVSCASSSSSDLIYVAGSAVPKDRESSSEVAWVMENQSAGTIRINKFGVSWTCLNDPGNVCSNWYFDYLKFDEPPVNDPNKIFDAAGASSPFPLTIFDRNVGKDANAYPYLDIAPGEVTHINEIEFVNAGGGKIEGIQAGTSVEFTVTWGDTNGNIYTHIFTVTW